MEIERLTFKVASVTKFGRRRRVCYVYGGRRLTLGAAGDGEDGGDRCGGLGKLVGELVLVGGVRSVDG